MTGPAKVTPEKKRKAVELRDSGLSLRSVASQLDISIQTLRRWLNPELEERERSKNRERKKRYGGVCADCGGPTSYSSKKHRIRRCSKCDIEHRSKSKKWNREAIIEAIQLWALIYGRPPTSVEWNRTLAGKKKNPKPHDLTLFPSAGSVYARGAPFKTWGDAIEAAGFPRPERTYHGRPRERYWTEERIVHALITHSKNGVAPLPKNWYERVDDHSRPTSAWVIRVFGSWEKACQAAGLKFSKEKQTRRATKLSAERISFVRSLIKQGVPRKRIAHRLWSLWGYKNYASMYQAFRRDGIVEIPGAQFRQLRHMTEEEIERAKELA